MRCSCISSSEGVGAFAPCASRCSMLITQISVVTLRCCSYRLRRPPNLSYNASERASATKTPCDGPNRLSGLCRMSHLSNVGGPLRSSQNQAYKTHTPPYPPRGHKDGRNFSGELGGLFRRPTRHSAKGSQNTGGYPDSVANRSARFAPSKSRRRTRNLIPGYRGEQVLFTFEAIRETRLGREGTGKGGDEKPPDTRDSFGWLVCFVQLVFRSSKGR